MNDEIKDTNNNQIFEELKLFNDSPLSDTLNDALNFDSYAHVIYESIMGTNTPCTVGIFGEWGMGKTSMMKMSKKNVDNDKDKNYLSVWFNAWQYEKEEHIIVPLIATIIKELKKRIKDYEEKEKKTYEDEQSGNNLKKILDEIKVKKSRLETTVDVLRSVASGLSGKISGKVPFIGDTELSINGKEIVSKYDELVKDALLEKSLYFDAYEKMEQLSSEKNNNEKIVIFIDDLDRCLPDNALKLLENIKLFLSQKGFVFVLGIAKEVVESYLKKRYKETYGNPEGNHGEAYLDKIVQIPIHIPSHHERTEELTEKMFNQIDDKLDVKLVEILKIVAKKTSGNPRSLVRLINRIKINSRIHELINKNKTEIKNEEERIYFFAAVCSMQEYFKKSYIEFLNFKRFRNYCIDLLSDKEMKKNFKNIEEEFDETQKEILIDIKKNESVLKDFLNNYYVKKLLKNEKILNETATFIKYNDNQSDLKDIFNPDLEKRHVEWLEKTKKLDTRNLKEFIKIDDKYEFSKYLVTNSWFDEFIKDEESKKLLDRSLNSYEEMYDENEEKFKGLSQPIINVSYYEAKAFCEWLSNKSQNSDDKIKYEYNLPTEEQFEYVALKERATQVEKDRKNNEYKLFPWGGEFNQNYCNNDLLNLKSTSVVGIFPDGDSPFGISDMSGNVWKWTNSDSKNFEGTKVLKGGSWVFDGGDFFSASINIDDEPGRRDYNVGFFLTRTEK